jgi:hypothetical protein
MLRKRAVQAAAILAMPLAVVLVVLAVDVLRAPGQLASDDVRFDAAPKRQAGLWEGVDFLPGDPALRLLGLEPDLAYRRAVALFVQVAPEAAPFGGGFGPEYENLQGRVQLELTTASAEDPNPKRRGQLLNLLGVKSLERYSSDAVESENILRRGVHLFRNAVETDPENADAKLNLELALRNAKAVNLPGTDPDAGAGSGTISGQGRSGSGY